MRSTGPYHMREETHTETTTTSKLHLVSLGCARNQVDSEIMLGRLSRAGWVLTPDADQADTIVVNTCSFIEAAADESIDTILALSELKQTGRCRRLIVTGCLPERYREDIAAALPEVDLFLGTGAFEQILAAVDDSLDTPRCLLPDPDRLATQVGDIPRVTTSGPMAYLKIAEGCSRRCTYCIIPRLRGRQKSRPLETIVDEARSLAAAGAKELVLVAQDTTAYGDDLKSGSGLSDLLARLAAACPRTWIRFLYGHPESIQPGVLETVAAHDNITNYFDIPIQHASSGILTRMGRRYTHSALTRLFGHIRAQVPGAVLRTTVIVGFPGETDREFETLLEFAREIRFDRLGVFVYSDAEDLPSHRLPDHVPPAVAQDRYDRLMRLQQEISSEINEVYLDRQLTVLVEERSEAGLYVGRTRFQAPEVDGITYVHGHGLPVGDFVDVRINDTLEYDLIGAAT